MNHAAKEQEGSENESLSTEIPALLVAGGSCSRLCRAQRTPSAIESATHRPAMTEDDDNARASARMKEIS